MLKGAIISHVLTACVCTVTAPIVVPKVHHAITRWHHHHSAKVVRKPIVRNHPRPTAPPIVTAIPCTLYGNGGYGTGHDIAPFVADNSSLSGPIFNSAPVVSGSTRINQPMVGFAPIGGGFLQPINTVTPTGEMPSSPPPTSGSSDIPPGGTSPVPEIDTWITMVMGLGAVGGIVRMSRKKTIKKLDRTL